MLVRRAALVHDVGVIGVSAGILDKAGRLTEAERERIRTHPYLTARTFSKPRALAAIGQLAAMHHERMDGSGYPSGLTADALPMTARVLAAADVYHALLEPRPHRAASTREVAEQVLTTEVTEGRLDGDAVRAVLDAAGHRVRRQAGRAGGLTAREVEVLVLISRGMTKKQIAQALNDLGEDGQRPRGTRVRQARREKPGRGGDVRDAARTDRGRRRRRLTTREDRAKTRCGVRQTRRTTVV